MLELCNVDVFYGPVQVLWGVSLTVAEGEIVALLGPNGAGKSTALKAAAGLVRPASGEVRYLGRNVHGMPSHEVVAAGLSLVPENRMLFPEMTVVENLELGAYCEGPRRERHKTLRWVYELFPPLAERKHQKVKTLSGGEQQMVAIGRALMAIPRLLLLDEPSLGLAPLLVKQLFGTLEAIKGQGISILLVEQDLNYALRIAHRAYVLNAGKTTWEGAGKDLVHDPAIRAAYLMM